MDLPPNRFKAALAEGRHQLGIWNSLGGNTVPEMLAYCGFDWIVLDTEHSPIEPVQILPEVQALAACPQVSTLVRPVVNDAALIKRYLDMGVQSLIVPYVQTPEEAAAAVAAMRYPPRGIRGVAGTTRASRYGNVKGYAARCEEELCLIVQVETAEAMRRLEEIAGTDGVDGVFIGPADLSASMGFPGQPDHPEVIAAIESAIARLKAVGVPSGLLTLNEDFARRCIALGTGFTAVGLDIHLLQTAAKALRGRFAQASR